jgi:hypothetical protein
MPKPPVTHTCYVLKRETRTSGRWLEIGTANIQRDGASGGHHVYLDRLPIGGFGGHILLVPAGAKPPDPPTQPERPGESSFGDDGAS